MDEATKQYLASIQKMADANKVISGLTDEQVWLSFLIGSFNLPNNVFLAINDENMTIFQYADKGLEEFKKRFHKE